MPTHTHIRPATLRDLPPIASISAASFWDEEVVGRIMHPLRSLYPDDYMRFWARRVGENYWDYGHRFVVVVVCVGCDEDEEGGKKEEVVVGVADWQRVGRGWEGVWGVWGWWDGRNLIKPLITFRNRVISAIWPNRAADMTQLDLETHMYPFIKHWWTGRANCWDLHSLAVAPAYQNRGYGRQLVKWGLEQAEREGVAASVLSAEGKERFYQRCGFVHVVGRATDGVGNPLAGRVRGGAILFRDPEDGDRERVIEVSGGDGD